MSQPSCTACGADLSSSAQFCGECGTESSQASTTTTVPMPAALDEVKVAPVWADSCTTLAQWLSGLLVVSGLLGLTLIPGLLSSLNAKRDYLAGRIDYLDAFVEINENNQVGLSFLVMISTLAVFVLFIVWTNRSYRNLAHFGLARYPKSTGWAIGGWFVPFYNAIVEKQIIDNVWRVTESGPLDHSWEKRDKEKLFHIGWLLFFGGLAISTYAGFEGGLRVGSSSTSGASILTVVDLPTRIFTLQLLAGVLTPMGQFFAAFGIHNISARYETKRAEVGSATTSTEI